MNQRRQTVDIQTVQHQQTLVITLAGSFDALTADQAQTFVENQFDEGHQHVVLDLGQVDFMSSAGIRVLLDVLRKSRGIGGDLRLAVAQPGVQRTLEISGLVRVLKVYPSVEEAVHSFSHQEA